MIEKNGRRKIRILACKKYYYEDKSVMQITQECSKCKNWVYKWIKRFYKFGLNGLNDLHDLEDPAKFQITK